MSTPDSPSVTGVHHISLTVTDIEASLDWYQRLLGATRMPVRFPHYDREETGYGELVMEPRSNIIIGLHTNVANDGQPFDEARTGLDHIGLSVASRDDLHVWAEWLDELGIEHTGVRICEEPFPFATVVFRDPDNIQLELFALG